jgi:nucleotide-binding universal stress UspA family protein
MKVNGNDQAAGVFERILLAVDAAPQAVWATELVARMAARSQAHVLIVHVLPSDLDRPTLDDLDEAVHAEHRAQGSMILEDAASRFNGGFKPEMVLREGTPATEIVAAAIEWKADVIVLGTHGRGRLSRFVLGSTAESVVRRAHCPVLTVAHGLPGSNGHAEPISEDVSIFAGI